MKDEIVGHRAVGKCQFDSEEFILDFLLIYFVYKIVIFKKVLLLIIKILHSV